MWNLQSDIHIGSNYSFHITDWQDSYRSCAQKEEAVWMWNLQLDIYIGSNIKGWHSYCIRPNYLCDQKMSKSSICEILKYEGKSPPMTTNLNLISKAIMDNPQVI